MENVFGYPPMASKMLFKPMYVFITELDRYI